MSALLQRFALVLVIALCGADRLCAQYWEPDPTFTPPALEAAPSSTTLPYQLLNDGSVIAFADGRYVNGQLIQNWVKLSPTGAIDPLFQGPPDAIGAFPLAAYPDSGLIIAISPPPRSFANYFVERVLPSGSIDPNFKPYTDGAAVICALTLPDQTVILGGIHLSVGSDHFGLLHLLSDGSVDTFFSGNLASYTYVYWLARESDGKLLIVENTSVVTRTSRVTRLNTDGSADASFTDRIGGDNAYVNWIVQLADGHLLASIYTEAGDKLVRTDNAGNIDPTFSLTIPNVRFSPFTSGEYVYFSSASTATQKYVGRVKLDGTLDSSFNILVESEAGDAPLAQVSTSGLVYLPSPLTNSRNAAHVFFSQAKSNGVINPAFAPRLGDQANQLAVTLQNDGKYLVLTNSSFVANHAVPANSFVRLNHDGSYSSYFPSIGQNVIYTPALQILKSGRIVGEYGEIFALNSDGTLASKNADPGFPHTVGPADSAPAFAADGSFYESHYDSSFKTYSIYHYSIDCERDTLFQFSTPESVSIYPAPNGTIYVDESASGLIRLKADGTVDPSFQNVSTIQGQGRTVWVFPNSTVLLTEIGKSNFVSSTPNDSAEGGLETHYDLNGKPLYIFDGRADIETIAGVVYDRLKTITATGNVATPNFGYRSMIIDAKGETTLVKAYPDDGDGVVTRLVRTSSPLSYNPAPLAAQISLTATVAAGTSTSMTARAGGLYPLHYQWYRNSNPISGATAQVLTIPSASADDAGSYAVQVSNASGQVTSPAATFQVFQSPQITQQPTSVIVAIGESATFSIAPIAGVTYSWQGKSSEYDWFELGETPGFTGADTNQLTIESASALLSGNQFRCLVTDIITGLVTASDPATLTIPGVLPDISKFSNISTRAYVGTGASIEIGGFIVTGSQPKQVLIRGLGPALTQYNVNGALSDPVLKLFSGQTQIDTNDDWSSDFVHAAAITHATYITGAEAFPQNSKDAALLVLLPPGGYTAQLTGKNGATGIGMIEVYEADTSATDSRLSNISTRSETRGGPGVQIAGFIISGKQPKKVLIRALGPALQPAHVNGFLDDPILSLYSGQTQVSQNDDWSNTESAATAVETATSAVGAAQLSRGTSDAAMVVTLSPGGYTAQVSGKNGHTGVTLIEVYEVP